MADRLGGLFSSLLRPPRAWSALPGSAKFALYIRLSTQFLLVLPLSLTGASAWAYSERYSGAHAASAWLCFLGVVVAAAWGLILSSHVPALNPRSSGQRPRLFAWGLSLTLVLWCVGNLAGALGGFIPGTALGFAAASILCLCYLPFLRRTWLLTGAVAALNTAAWWPLPREVIPQGPSISLAVSLLVPPLYVFSTLSSAWAIRLIAEAERAAELQRHLILAEERLRFAQEMHDTLGQRLAAINIKAELALALARRDDDRFRSELSDLRGLAATSVSEMHDVVRGYRDIDIATEIEEARRLLRAGGIALSVEGRPHDLPEAHRELAAWLVREAATNILRHSEATVASLRMSDACLAISNNNPGAHLGSPRAGGLDALRRRAARQGALLIVDSTDKEFHVKLLTHKEGAQ